MHGFAGISGTESSSLSIATPGVFRPAYLEEIGRGARSGRSPDLTKMLAVMTRHGLTPVRPA